MNPKYPLGVQAVYFSVTGIWPWVHIESFMAVTGPKTDIWLTQTVGALIVAIAAALFYAIITGRISAGVFILAILSAAVLGITETYFVLNGTISGIYLADAAIELVLIIMLLLSWVKSRH